MIESLCGTETCLHDLSVTPREVQHLSPVADTDEAGDLAITHGVVEVLKSVLTGPIPQTRTSTSTLDIVDLRDIVSVVQVQKKKFRGLEKKAVLSTFSLAIK